MPLAPTPQPAAPTLCALCAPALLLLPVLALLPACGGKDDCLFHRDADGDGYAAEITLCEPPPDAIAGPVSGQEDCDDASAAIHPGASDGDQACDGLDNDCDGDVDEDETTVLWYTDADGDGYGDETLTTEQSTCEGQPAGTSAVAGDCDDAVETGATSYPGANEQCSDGVDQDCDGADAACALFQTITLAELGAVEFAGGTAIAALGDVTGDGLADFAVGYAGSDAVEIYATDAEVLGVSGALTGASGTAFGASLAAGDFDGDEVMDLAVGAPGGHSVSIYYGDAWNSVTSAVGSATRTQGGAVVAAVPVADGADSYLTTTRRVDGRVVDWRGYLLTATMEQFDDGVPLGDYGVVEDEAGTAIWPLSLSSAEIGDDSAAESWLAVGFSDGTTSIGPGVAVYDTSGALLLKLTDAWASTTALGAAVAIGELAGHTVLAAGAPDAYDGDGAVYLLEDPTGSEYSVYDWDPGSSSGDDAERASWSCEAGAALGVGSALGIVGDVEGDGDGELAIGGLGTLWLVAPGDSGMRTGDLPERAAGAISGFDGAVTAVLNAGDVDGDGSEDLLVVDASAAWLLYGGRAP